MDWLSNLWDQSKGMLLDVGAKALGVQKPTSPTSQAATKGTDTTARQTEESMPKWLWLVLAAALVVVVAFARRR